jgi:uncharacterized RmlC-like cupin family protein
MAGLVPGHPRPCGSTKEENVDARDNPELDGSRDGRRNEMVPYDKQTVTVVRQTKVGVDVNYEPPLRVGFGISDKTVDIANAVMGRTVLVPGAGPNPTHYHANNDVCWYIVSGSIRLIQAKSDCSDRKEVILQAGDFVYIPSGAIHVIANASQTEEASLVFCYIGVPNVEASGNVWLTNEHDAFVAPGP